MPDGNQAKAAEVKRREINLDAARAERAAQRGEPPVLTVDGKSYELPHELPTDFVELVIEERLRAALRLVIGSDADELKLSVEDWEYLAEEVADAYGIKGGLKNLRPSGS